MMLLNHQEARHLLYLYLYSHPQGYMIVAEAPAITSLF